jgi:glucose/arabinose dehydrogenase
MKTRIALCGAVAAFLALGLSACSQPGPEPAEPAADNTAADVPPAVAAETPPAEGAGRGGRGGRGIPVPAMAENASYEYQTHQERIRVNVLTKGLRNPWAIAFLPDQSLLITERDGQLRHFRDGTLSAPIAGMPEVRSDGFISGLHDIVLHPDFDQNNMVYFVYNKPVPVEGAAPAADGGAAAEGGRGRGGRGGANVRSQLTVARAVWDGTALQNVEDVISPAGASTVSRLLFLPDGTLLVGTWGEPEPMAQDKLGLSGKILRYTEDGEVPADNPFVGNDEYAPEIYSLGHRTPESLVYHEGRVFESEMGPNGGDEINIIVPGGNYGWPLVSLGRTYAGPYQPEVFEMEGMIDPIVNFVPSISVTNMAFYTGSKFPNWTGNLFIGGVRFGEIPGTGRLQRIVMNENFEETSREELLTDLRVRIRGAWYGPDELLYVLTDEADGALLRIEPLE